MNKTNYLALLFPITACALDAVETGSTDQAIVGNLTAQRPEIGIVAAGGGCTGTLVSPHAVLTAAHCLNPAYYASTPPAGSVYYFYDKSHALHTIPVDKLVSFHPQGDVALLHLATTIPDAWATPAEISAVQPDIGEAVTAFGWGCNVRDPETGAFTVLRFATFSYSVSTNYLCHGDSGGPAMFGYATNPGAIWGINDEFGPDRFALVSQLKTQIEDVMRDWDGMLEGGFDRPGMDYATTTASTASACSTICRNDGACRSFSYVASTSNCYLKAGVPELVPASGVTSGIAPSIEVSFDRPGYDYTQFTQTNVPECQSLCANDSRCKAWTLANGTCFLKDTVPYGQPSGSCTSGVVDRMFEHGFDRPGGDLRQTWASSNGHCAKQCANDASCRAFTYSATRTVPGMIYNCWLKNEVYPAVASPAFESGVRRGLDVSSYRVGTYLRTFDTRVPLWSAAYASPSSANALVCQSECAKDAACTSWSYALADDYGGTCELFKGLVGVGASAPRSISGVKGLELVR